MPMFMSGETANDWLTKPVSGISELSGGNLEKLPSSVTWTWQDINQPNKVWIGKYFSFSQIEYLVSSKDGCPNELQQYNNKHNLADKNLLFYQIAAEVANEMRLSVDEARSVGSAKHNLYLKFVKGRFCFKLTDITDSDNSQSDKSSSEIDVPGIRSAAKQKCPNANINALTDAQIISAGQSVMAKYQNLSIAEFMAKSTQIQAEILGAVCGLAGGNKSSGFVMPKWGWPAIIGVVVIGGYFIFRR